MTARDIMIIEKVDGAERTPLETCATIEAELRGVMRAVALAHHAKDPDIRRGQAAYALSELQDVLAQCDILRIKLNAMVTQPFGFNELRTMGEAKYRESLQALGRAGERGAFRSSVSAFYPAPPKAPPFANDKRQPTTDALLVHLPSAGCRAAC